MAESTIIKNATVYDYANKTNGEQKSILIEKGKIVQTLKDEQTAKSIDGSQLIALPGFIDIGTHIFSPEVNWCRVKALNENNYVNIPTIPDIQTALMKNGFTTVAEMDVPMTQAKSTLYNMNQAPLLDKLMIMDFGSNWTFISDLEAEGHVEKIAVVLSYLMSLVKGYGISINNPYHQQFWKLSEGIPENPQKVPIFKFPVFNAYKKFTAANIKGNFTSSLFISPYDRENIKETENIKNLIRDLTESGQNSDASKKIHLSRANHYLFDDESSIINLSKKNGITVDINPITFGFNRPLITRDRNLAKSTSASSGIPITTVDLEFDTEYYITSRNLLAPDDRSNSIFNSGLATILKFKSENMMDSAVLSSNMPYNSCPVDWYSYIGILLSSKARASYMASNGLKVDTAFDVIKSDITLDPFDLSAILSSNPARVLGLDKIKGHLGSGADADIILYDKHLFDEIKNSPDGEIRQDLLLPKYLMKSGSMVIDNGQYMVDNEDNMNAVGRVYWNRGSIQSERTEKIREMKNLFFTKHFSMYMEAITNKSDNLIEYKQ